MCDSAGRTLSINEVFGPFTEEALIEATLKGEGRWGPFFVQSLVVLVSLSILSCTLQTVTEWNASYSFIFKGRTNICSIKAS
jgi:hypothetical protein